VAVVGGVGLGAAAAADPAAARAAAASVWSPFVLVAGLLLVGLVAEDDGLFRVAGHRLARLSGDGRLLFAGGVVLVVMVTAVLNLDTSVVFITPVLVHAARSRGQREEPLLYGSLLLANAGSLPLPGSNLTNLIVVGPRHLSGAVFFSHTALSWFAAVTVTAAVVALVERPWSDRRDRSPPTPPPAVLGVGATAVGAVVVLVLVLRSPALPVAAVGVVAVATRVGRRRLRVVQALDRLEPLLLVGLFGVAVALGTLGRTWSGPARALGHLDSWGTAVLAGGASVVVNNLPAASLLASRATARPDALLIGLDVGPNLLFTGSLAWLLWLRAARATGARPSLRRASLLGAVSVPPALALAVAALAVTGGH